MLGRDSGFGFAAPLVVTLFIRLTNTARARRSTRRRAGCRPCLPEKDRNRQRTDMTLRSCLTRLGVEKLENLAGAFGADARNLAEVGERRPLDFLQGAEVVQQS